MLAPFSTTTLALLLPTKRRLLLPRLSSSMSSVLATSTKPSKPTVLLIATRLMLSTVALGRNDNALFGIDQTSARLPKKWLTLLRIQRGSNSV